MTDKFDAQTGRRLYSAVDELSHKRYYLERVERELKDAEYSASLTLWQRIKVSVIILSICVPATVAFTWVSAELRTQIDVGGYIFLVVVAGFAVLGSIGTLLEGIDNHRGGAARVLVYCSHAVDQATRDVENTEQEITVVRQMQEDRAAEEAARPSPEELLSAIVSTAARDLATTERDSALWNRVADDPADSEAWAALSDVNGWTPELTSKIRGLQFLTSRLAKSLESDGTAAGWAG